MKSLLLAVLGFAALAIAAPSETLAQGRHNARVIVIRGDDFDDDDFERRHFRHQKKGPKFCRTGAGHPVFGRQWCREKGFALGHHRHFGRDRDRGGIIFRGEDEAVVIGRDGDIVFRPRRLFR